MDQVDQGANGPKVEVLELGASRAGRASRHFWLRLALVALTVIVVLVAGGAAWRWRQSTAPTLTSEEVAEVYASPLPPQPGALNWDSSTRLVQRGGDEVTTAGIEPAECAGIVNADDRLVSVDLVSVNLAPVVRPDGGQVYSGTIATYRYEDPADARTKFAVVRDQLGRCTNFEGSGTRFTVDQVAIADRSRSRSDLSFRLDDTQRSLRVSLIQFGNTVTWITTAATADSVTPSQVVVSDLLIARMQTIYRAR